MSIQEKIKEIQLEINRTQKNKKTEYHLALLKARLARLKEPVQQVATKEEGWEVRKSGDARISLVGFPSVGKSTLMSKISSVESKAADYEFTTVDCVAGILSINGALIQVLDLPGIIVGANDGKGRGRQVIATARTSDLILMVLDARKNDKNKILEELGKMNIRVNTRKPPISFEKKSNGGVQINMLTKDVDLNMVSGILKELKIKNCSITIFDKVGSDEIIDIVTKRAFYINCIFVYNKIDFLSVDELDALDSEDSCVISAEKGWNLDELIDKIWDKLGLKRIYTRKRGMPDFNTPIIVRKDATVRELCDKIHKDFSLKFKACQVWGSSVKHNPQQVGINHVLDDEDVVKIYI
ncbi:Developmentally-regulated GTP-binding protein 2 like protein [Dictyocoela muelleri]|nr:Developmentally-regulated GTP-binding protein 2 like protein [Dictyocoela muelleri]